MVDLRWLPGRGKQSVLGCRRRRLARPAAKDVYLPSHSEEDKRLPSATHRLLALDMALREAREARDGDVIGLPRLTSAIHRLRSPKDVDSFLTEIQF